MIFLDTTLSVYAKVSFWKLY